MANRQIVLDTETTGLEPSQGHKIIEIGGVELINRRHSDRHFHQYLNPEREIDAGALEVHGLTSDFLSDKPVFAQVVDDFIGFIEGAELIIHNAAFDIGFIDSELKIIGHSVKSIRDICTVVDSLAVARKKHPGQKNNLDALCKRYSVDNSNRELHGALLDSQILADVYLLLTGGQTALMLDAESDLATVKNNAHSKLNKNTPRKVKLPVIEPSAEELAAHEALLDTISVKSDSGCLWRDQAQTAP
jgi:DNA polymerase-3 subunit epsilon